MYCGHEGVSHTGDVPRATCRSDKGVRVAGGRQTLFKLRHGFGSFLVQRQTRHTLTSELAPAGVVDPATVLAWMDRLRALDPLVRLDDFAIGLLDTGNIAYFLAITTFSTIAAVNTLG